MRNRRTRPVGVLALLTLAVVPSATSGTQAPTGVQLGNSDALLQSYLEAQRREQARQAFVGSPEARAARHESRTAFRNQTVDQAADVAVDHFGGLVRDAMWEGVHARTGARVLEYRGDHVALIKREGDAHASLLDSMLPLVAKDERGDERPVSVALVDQGAWFAPDNALVAVRLSKRLSDGIWLTDAQLKVTLGQSGDTSARRVGARAFYGNTQTDTDWVAGPTPTGVALYAQLRSPQAPEKLTMGVGFTSGVGVSLAENDQGGVDVFRDGGRVATVSPPFAFDAQQTPVPARYIVEGDQIAIDVDHADRDIAYPVLVDPVWDYQDWNHNSPQTPSGWVFWPESPNFFSLTDGQFGRGLYSVVGWPGGGGIWYGNFWRGWWYYQAPGPQTGGTAYIYRADYNYTTHAQPANSGPPVCLTRGIFTGSDWELSAPWWHASPGTTPSYGGAGPATYCSGLMGHSMYQCIRSDCLPNDITGRARNLSAFAQWTAGDGNRTDWIYSYLGMGGVMMSDAEPPSISGGPAATVNDPAQQWTFSYSDPGLGPRQVEISSPTFPSWNQATTITLSCAGTAGSPCQYGPQSRSQTYGNLPPGTHTIRVKVLDAGQRATPRDWTVNVGYYTSWKYGGTNHVVDTDAEADSAIAAINASGSDETEQWLIDGLYPDDRVYVTLRFRDEDGEVPTADFVPVGSSTPPDEVVDSFLTYASEPGGYLTASQASAAQSQPVSTGSCTLYRPRIYRYLDYARARQGKKAYFYTSGQNAKCSSSVYSVNCYTELWRGKPGPNQVFVGQESRSDNLQGTACSAYVYSDHYRRPRKHFSKNTVTMIAPAGHFWGTGAGPDGWDCTGQKTRTLQCRRDHPPKS